MRSLSLNFRQALFAQESTEVAVALLTITHPSLAQAILLSGDATQRLSTDPLVYGTVSRGQNYLYVGMELQLPEEAERTPPTAKMTLSNIDGKIIPLARSIISPAQVRIEMVLASAPDVVEISIPAMDMVNVTYDAAHLAFDLAVDAFALEPYPAGSFDPASFPAMFI